MHTLDLYLDLDGVFADYEGEYRRLTGGDPSEKGKNKFQRFKNFPHFYRNLPLLPDAMKLWHFVKDFEPKFLSAASNYLKTSREDKYAWVHQHFGVTGPRVIVVNYPNEKYKHAGPNKILIDDNAKNCDEWRHAGGIAIHHKSVDDTIHQLKALLARSEAHHVTETFQAMKDTPNVIEAFQTLEIPTTSNVSEAFDNLWKMLEAGTSVSEMYNEPTDSSVTDNGKQYDLNGILSATLAMQIHEIPVSLLTWIFQFDNPITDGPERVESADLNAPILISKEDSRLVVIDGLHRLEKAVKESRSTIKAIFVRRDLLDRYEIRKTNTKDVVPVDSH